MTTTKTTTIMTKIINLCSIKYDTSLESPDWGDLDSDDDGDNDDDHDNNNDKSHKSL